MASKIIRNYIPEIGSRLTNWSRPKMVTINLTARCNQQCIYCEIGKESFSTGNDSLDFDDMVWIFDQMALNKIHKIALCGGEPFLFNRIIDVVSYANTRNVRCYITTNGMNIHSLKESELQVLKACRAEINISIDSFQESVQSFTRGNSTALSNALESTDILRRNGIPVTVLSVITKFNYTRLFNFFTTACEKGIRQVLFQPVIYFSNFPDRPALEHKEELNVEVDQIPVLMDELKKILQFEKRHRIHTNVYRIIPWIEHYIRTASQQNGHWFFHKLLNQFFCREIYAIIDISYEGYIQPCGLAPARINIFENRDAGLMELWSRATKKIKEDLKHDRYYDFCNACCHHFSRNMYASLMKHPVKNRKALGIVIPLILNRIWWRFVGKMN